MQIIFFLLGTVIISIDAFNYCDENRNDTCNCIPSLNGNEYQCANNDIVVKFESSKEVYIIGWAEDDPELYKNVELPDINASSARYLQIKFCPNINISRVVDHFGMNELKIFKYELTQETDLHLGSEDLKLLKNIEFLSISDSVLTLDEDFLKYTTKLKKLNLNTNNLAELDYYFNSSTLLDYLNLSDNQITSIPDEIFRNLSELKRLELWHNNLTGLTENSFLGLNQLKLLELSYNHIQEISEKTFATLTDLEELSLKQNNIQNLHKETFKNNQMLKKLRLDYNYNLNLQDYLLSNLTHLQEINLEGSNIKDLPEHLFEGSSNLMDINISNNTLENLPQNIFKNLKNLTVVNLSNNKLKTLPKFSELKNLNKLLLNNNKLKIIENEIFNGLTRLKILDLSKNKIHDIEDLAFQSLEALEQIDLSFNAWTMPVNIVSTPLNDCTNLKVVNLHHNRIDTFPYDLYNVLVEVQYLNMSYNPIEVVEVHTFARVVNQEIVIDLSNTKIEFLYFGGAEFLAKTNLEGNQNVSFTTKLLLHNNKVFCNCSNYGLLSYNAGLYPNLRRLLDIHQETLYCTNSIPSRRILDLHPGDCAYPSTSCPDKCSCNYRPFNKTFNVDCSFRNLSDFPNLNQTIENYFKYNQTTVDLRGNKLVYVPNHETLKNVTIMNLSNNSISHISYVPPHIQEMHLDNNKLTYLNKSFLDSLGNVTELRKITLKENPWICDCNARHLQYFLQKYHQKIDDVRCAKDNALLSKAVNLCPQSLLLLVALPMLLGILLVFSITFALYYRYQEDIKIYLFHKGWLLWFVTENEMDKDKKYDVFVSYAHQDDEFVEKVLLNELENGEPQYKVCVHARDWEPGEFIPNHVLRSVKESRRTLIVLTSDFLNSVWGRYEFKTAHTEAVKEGLARVIVIIKGDLNEESLDEEMRNYLKFNTYVKWEDKYFWQKLKYALPHSAKQNYERDKERNKKHANIMLKIDDKFQLVSTPSPSHTSTPPLTLDPGLLKVKTVETTVLDGEEPLFIKKMT